SPVVGADAWLPLSLPQPATRAAVPIAHIHEDRRMWIPPASVGITLTPRGASRKEAARRSPGLLLGVRDEVEVAELALAERVDHLGERPEGRVGVGDDLDVAGEGAAGIA